MAETQELKLKLPGGPLAWLQQVQLNRYKCFYNHEFKLYKVFGAVVESLMHWQMF